MSEQYRDLPALLTIKKTAEIMGVSRDYCYKLLRNGELPTKELSGKTWVLRDPLLKMLGCVA